MRALATLAAVLVAGCYSPAIAPGTYKCGPNRACPDGQLCNAHGCCVNDANDSNTCAGNPSSDGAMGGPKDMSAGDTTGGCRGGARALADHGWANVALCTGGWALPGVVKTPACAGAPDDKGTYKGNMCAIADNCATGWRVCSDDDLVARGVTRGMCTDVHSGIWLLQVLDDALQPTCGVASSSDTLIWGCGDTFQADGAMHCKVATHSMDVRDCMSTTGPPTPFNCNAHIGTSLTKIGAGGGGVMCCKE